ncbi:MAG: CAP domain-containing protein [Actinomycetota bacterium]
MKHGQKVVAATVLAAGLFQTVTFGGANAEQTQTPPAGQQTAQRPPDPVRDCLEDRVKLLRAEHGVATVTEHPALATIAQQHSAEMAATGTMYHTGPNVLQTLPAGWRAYGEDVVFGLECDSMWTAFMDSPPHRETILRSDFNYSGVATSQSADGVTYATVVFMRFVPIPITPLVPKLLGKPKAPAPGVPAPASPTPDPTAIPAEPVAPPAPEVPVISLNAGSAAPWLPTEIAAETGPLTALAATALAGEALAATPQSAASPPGSGPGAFTKSESYQRDLEVEPGLAIPRPERSANAAGAAEIVFEL